MTRLIYETKGGGLSRAQTFEQALEHARLLAEAFHMLGHEAKAQGDLRVGEIYLAYGQMIIEKLVPDVTLLETRGRFR